VARVPACLAGSRGFDSRTGRQITAAVAQSVERRPEEPGVGGSKPSCGTSPCLLSSAGFRAPAYEAGGRTFESCRGRQFTGVWQSGRMRLAVNQVLIGTVVRIHPHPPLRACSSIGRAPVSKTDGSRFDPVRARQRFPLGIAKRSKATVCKSVGVMPSLVRIQLPSPFPGSSVGRSAWLLTRRSAVRGRVGEPTQMPRVAQRQSTVLIRRGSVDRTHPRGPVHQRVGEPGQSVAFGTRRAVVRIHPR
jgi:hypothetical protein